MFQIKKILISFILIFFLILIPKASAKYVFLSDVKFEFEVENSSNEDNQDEFFIYNLDDLKKFRDLQNSGQVNFEGKDIYLMADIDLPEENWVPIATPENPFKGNFHGNFHTISNLTIATTSNYQGFFAQNNGLITESIVSGNITANNCENIGGIAGKNEGTISYSRSNVDITGNASKVGGISGISKQGEFIYCVNYHNISGNDYIGGICGYSESSYFEKCGNEANITATNEFCGGIVGYFEHQKDNRNYAIVEAYNFGIINGVNCVGGIAGQVWDMNGQIVTMQYCYNRGAIKTKSENNGGILGGTYNTIVPADMNINKMIISDCFNIGNNIYTKANQISCKYATVTNSYYISGSRNTSGYGTAIAKNRFNYGASQTNSIFPVLRKRALNTWALDSNLDIILSWQNESWLK